MGDEMQCRYCLKDISFPIIPLEDIDARAYCAGKIEWQHLGLVCSSCREYLRGNWRYHKKKVKITFYSQDKVQNNYTLPNQYCVVCRQCKVFRKLNKKGFVKAGFKSLDCYLWQCPTCKSIFIFDLVELWKRAQKFYRDLVEVKE